MKENETLMKENETLEFFEDIKDDIYNRSTNYIQKAILEMGLIVIAISSVTLFANYNFIPLLLVIPCSIPAINNIKKAIDLNKQIVEIEKVAKKTKYRNNNKINKEYSILDKYTKEELMNIKKLLTNEEFITLLKSSGDSEKNKGIANYCLEEINLDLFTTNNDNKQDVLLEDSLNNIKKKIRKKENK